MLYLPKPVKSSQEYFSECISKTGDPSLKTRLESCEGNIEGAGNNYDNLATAGQLYSYQHVVGLAATEKELHDVYDNGCVRLKGPGRYFYDQIKMGDPYGRCAFCGHRDATNLDHFLPRSKYQELSVCPINLVPICDKCNGKSGKGTHDPVGSQDQFIHPYFDDVTADRWLSASVETVDGEFNVAYHVVPPAHWSAQLSSRVNFQFKRLNLAHLYENQAAQQQSSIEDILKVAQCFHKLDIRDHLAEIAGLKLARNANSWEAVMYDVLSNHQGYLESIATRLVS